jgi:hypothetical protein
MLIFYILILIQVNPISMKYQKLNWKALMDLLEDFSEVITMLPSFYTVDHHENYIGQDLYGGKLNIRLP